VLTTLLAVAGSSCPQPCFCVGDRAGPSRARSRAPPQTEVFTGRIREGFFPTQTHGGDLAHAIDESDTGGAVGQVTSVAHEPVANQNVARALQLLGNDGTFFDDDLAAGAAA